MAHAGERRFQRPKLLHERWSEREKEGFLTPFSTSTLMPGPPDQTSRNKERPFVSFSVRFQHRRWSPATGFRDRYW
ncbi:hypothetical protein E1A91_D04G186300v1 [Gossypium mustelinum]|uniref:Uncharacterized protein n=1 Tax=Gossypium mustelinum TaxID=34275 RepID=A0A5D2VFH6_GOSMU|nr:hypothetical protein E1A91_D04G186300v1 [Gossypium mustelinum]